MFNLFSKDKKKSKGYFLELDESAESQPEVAEVAESPEPAPETPVEAVQTTKAEPVPETPVEPVQTTEVVQETKPPSDVAKPTSKKKTQKTSKQAAATAPSPAAEWEPPFWVKAMKESTQKKAEEKAQPGMSFAPSNLLPLSRPRRRPGPSLNTFRNLARQAKTPKV